MRKSLLLVAAIIFSLGSFAQTRVLFIGNSYTYGNNLPQLTYEVALSTNDTLIFDSHAPGGARLMQHAQSAQAISKIFSDDWDYVVLQAQSQEPSWPIAQVQTEVFPYAKSLCDTIRANNACSMPVFFMTWGRKNGDSFNCPNWPPVCTYLGMDSLLNERYQTMGEDNDAFVSPVGAVWRYIRANYPTIELYTPDESHPSMEGSYAAACTFYTIFLRKDPTQISYIGGANPAMVDDIKSAVKAVVYDSLLKWNVGEFDPVADYTEIPNPPSISFTNNSINADSYFWDFDDGNTSTQENPTHTYTIPALYDIKLVAEKCGITDTISKEIGMAWMSVEERYGRQFIEVAPNPTEDFLTVTHTEQKQIQRYSITDLSGKSLIEGPVFGRIDVSILPAGNYILQVWDQNDQRYTVSFLKK